MRKAHSDLADLQHPPFPAPVTCSKRVSEPFQTALCAYISMKVIIYIGHHKVGSTALQVFLSQNWQALARAGILYPSVEVSGFTHALAQLLKLGDGNRTGHGGMNVREPHSALAYQMIAKVSDRKVPPQFKRLPGVPQMLHALRKQVEILQPNTVILCSEAFANFGQIEPELITHLMTAFPKAEVEVYGALRRPDEYLISWHGQRLKVGEKLRPLDNGGLEPYFNTIHFNFRTVVEAWSDRLPDARLILRPYREILKSGGSIDDFTSQISIDFPANLPPPGRANQSLPRAAMEIVRRANHDLARPISHGLTRYFLEAGDTLKPTPNNQVEMFSASIRQDLARRFAPIHDYLSELTGTAAFFDDIDEMTHECPVPQAQAAAQLLAQIAPKNLPNKELRDYIEAQQRATAI